MKATAAALAGLVGMLTSAGVPPAGQRISSRVEAVRVDVSVSRDGRPVEGLTAADFELTDNNVAQHVDLVLYQDAPVDVLLALDVSGSVRGAALEALRQAGHGLVETLQAGDRAAAVTFTDHISLRTPFTSDPDRLRAALALEPQGGETSLYDALHAAMVLAETSTGRPLVIVFSDGADTSSFLDAEAVMDTARRTGAVVYAVVTAGADRSVLDRLVDLTGGEVLRIQAPERMQETFAGILTAFRQRYVLSYSPSGVASSGWHTLAVKVRGRGVRVRGRPGYLAGS